MISDHFAFHGTAERGFFMDLRTGDLYRLNPTGIRIIQSLRSGMTPDQLAQVISAEFEVGYDQAEHDITRFLQRLAALEDGR
ncbi:PqqD family protein [bacterium]|nr:PqqD family protein [candidate division CSSED10-310 bacterium]